MAMISPSLGTKERTPSLVVTAAKRSRPPHANADAMISDLARDMRRESDKGGWVMSIG